jgi:hypothetical protein
MNLNELQAQLRAHPELNLLITLPDGGRVPAHFHVTEVGHVAKKFVDCGGTFRASEACVLQTYIGSPRDDGHRLVAGKLAHILELAKPILPAGDLPVEVEYEDGVVSQFPLTGMVAEAGGLVLQLGLKHTDCLAKDRCGIDDGCGCAGEAAESERCCAGEPAKAGTCC